MVPPQDNSHTGFLKVGEFGLRKETGLANNSIRRGEHWLPPGENETQLRGHLLSETDRQINFKLP